MDEKEFKKWFDEAKATFKAIDSDLKDCNYNWACFKAQQASEFSFKALLWGIGKPTFGHSLITFLEEARKILKKPISTKLQEHGAKLDKFYVPTRYANQWPEKPPHLLFTKGEAEEAKRMAKEMLDFVEKCWRLLKKEEKKGRS